MHAGVTNDRRRAAAASFPTGSLRIFQILAVSFLWETSTTMASMLDTGTKPLLVYNPDHSLHDGRMNENAGRVRAAVEALRSSGRWEQCEILTTLVPSPTEDVAAVLHTAHHLASLRAAFGQASGWFCAVCTLENVEGATGCAVCGTERAAPGGAAEGSVEFIIPEGKTSRSPTALSPWRHADASARRIRRRSRWFALPDTTRPPKPLAATAC